MILADSKSPERVLEAGRLFLEARGRAIFSRLPDDLYARLPDHFPETEVDAYPEARALVIRRPGVRSVATGGVVGVITAGTSDVPIAEEARMVAVETGCSVLTAFDCGVAGIHRLSEPLRGMRQASADAIIVAAGMDGALPSVVCGLVDVPVIGLPVSVGYGLGGRGVAALLSMLQTCSPGMSVVNIDNGVGAGAAAALIANRAAAARAASAASEARA